MKISFENEEHHNGFDMITIDLTDFKLCQNLCPCVNCFFSKESLWH